LCIFCITANFFLLISQIIGCEDIKHILLEC